MEYICKYCGKVCKNENSLKQHEVRCKENPNRISLSPICSKGNNPWNKGLTKETDERVLQRANAVKEAYLSGKIQKEGKPHTEETKKKISESMKLAHAEGRAHNIGESRWNNEPSYPEKWFMEVIKNELENKDYIREFPFHKYSLDFAWPQLKICIEIDGDQHYRFEEYKKRDREKDFLLEKEGWKLLRICWKDCYQNPKFYISKTKELFL